MIQWLTYIGLATVPFVIAHGGGRYPKEIVSTGLAAAIGFLAISRGLFKPISNKFLFITIFFMLATTALVPPSGVSLGLQRNNTIVMDNRLDIDNLWNYKPILYAILYLLMVCALASIQIESIEDYLSVMAWAGTITAIAALLQHIGLNQFWSVKPTIEIGNIANPEMTSFIGQPTLTAAFICICLIPSLYLKKYWMSVVMCGAVILTGSAFGKLGIFSSLLFWFVRGKFHLFLISILLIVVTAVFMLFFLKITDHGRLVVWQQAISDLKRPMVNGVQYGFTGYGAGAYHYANQLMHNSPWAQAHNEFIEFLFNNGALGFLLLIGAHVVFFRECLSSFYDKETYALFCIFLVTCLMACGTFIWQLAVGQFYTATVLGLAYNRFRNKENINA